MQKLSNTTVMKYPIGIQSFDRIIEDGYVYVDKTELIYNLTHESSIYFLSRPRRFGKSLLVSTLKNYYLGRRELFRKRNGPCIPYFMWTSTARTSPIPVNWNRNWISMSPVG